MSGSTEKVPPAEITRGVGAATVPSTLKAPPEEKRPESPEGKPSTLSGPASGGPASGGPASGGPASGGPASGGPASGGPASGGPASGAPASGGPASGGPASPWV